MQNKLREQDKFLLKYNISANDFESTEIKWEDLESIYDNYIKEIPKLEDSATYIFQRLMKMNGIHSVRYRVKDAEHLIAKIIRKKIEIPSKETVTTDNYKSLITDLIGVRALHLFKEDWLPIHNEILTSWDTKEKPVANYREGDSDEFIKTFEENGCEKKIHKYGYRSIHYIIKTQPAKQLYYAEVQVRTIFEEAWSEIDHTIRYPYDQDNPIFGEFLLILNRLAGSADEMGTFIQVLKTNLKQKESLFESEIESKNQTIKDLEEKIRKTTIKQTDKEDLMEGLERLKSHSIKDYKDNLIKLNRTVSLKDLTSPLLTADSILSNTITSVRGVSLNDILNKESKIVVNANKPKKVQKK